MSSSIGKVNTQLIKLIPFLRSLKYFLPIQYDIHIFLRYDGIPHVERLLFAGIVREATENDLPLLIQCNPKPERFRERFHQGDRCLVAETPPGEIIGYEWFSAPPYHRDQKYHYKISIPQEAFYLYDAFIRPQLRVSGVWLALKAYMGKIMKEEGKSALITYVSHNNALSLRTHFRFGFRVYERVTVVTLGPFSYTHRTPLVHSPELVKELIMNNSSSP